MLYKALRPISSSINGNYLRFVRKCQLSNQQSPLSGLQMSAHVPVSTTLFASSRLVSLLSLFADEHGSWNIQIMNGNNVRCYQILQSITALTSVFSADFYRN